MILRKMSCGPKIASSSFRAGFCALETSGDDFVKKSLRSGFCVKILSERFLRAILLRCVFGQKWLRCRFCTKVPTELLLRQIPFKSVFALRTLPPTFCAKVVTERLLRVLAFGGVFRAKSLAEACCAPKRFGHWFARWSLPLAVLRQTVFGEQFAPETLSLLFCKESGYGEICGAVAAPPVLSGEEVQPVAVDFTALVCQRCGEICGVDAFLPSCARRRFLGFGQRGSRSRGCRRCQRTVSSDTCRLTSASFSTLAMTAWAVRPVKRLRYSALRRARPVS